MVLDHLIRLQHVGADLAAPRDFFFVLAELLELLFFLRCSSSNSRARRIFIAIARFLCCERSFWQVTTMSVGRCVKRTAESVLLTCWPPAPDARNVSIRRSAGLMIISILSSTRGENEDRRERRMAPRVGVVGRDSHQPMYPGLGAQIAVREVAFDREGRALDSRAVAGLQVGDLGFEAAPLGPSQIKPQQHLGPVLRLLTAGARMYREDRAEAIVLAARASPAVPGDRARSATRRAPTRSHAPLRNPRRLLPRPSAGTRAPRRGLSRSIL